MGRCNTTRGPWTSRGGCVRPQMSTCLPETGCELLLERLYEGSRI